MTKKQQTFGNKNNYVHFYFTPSLFLFFSHIENTFSIETAHTFTHNSTSNGKLNECREPKKNI